MKSAIILCLALAAMTTLPAQPLMAAPAAQPAASHHPFALGFVLGSNTALYGKYSVNSEVAYDLGLSFFGGDYALIYGDYLKHYPRAMQGKDKALAGLVPYVGIGGLIAIASSARAKSERFLGTSSGSIGMGVRVPFGLEWFLGEPPLSFFGELAPGISIVPATEAIFQIGVGLKYQF